MSKILLLGASGQLGASLKDVLSGIGTVNAFTRTEMDINDHAKLMSWCDDVRPEYIINAAAFTAVDLAESQNDLANLVNAESVQVLAEIAKGIGAWLIHYSTDYVFDGKRSSYRYKETDNARPISAYGKSKLEGEIRIRNSGCKHIIIRTSWVYSVYGSNFAKTILKMASERNTLKVVVDQIGTPTSARRLALTTKQIVDVISRSDGTDTGFSGIYNCTPKGSTSWHGFAMFLLTTAISKGYRYKTKPSSVIPVNSSEMQQIAERPKNSVLDISKLSAVFSEDMPLWTLDANQFLNEYLTHRDRPI